MLGPSSFEVVETPEGKFDAVTCDVAKRYDKHGTRYGSLRNYTAAAVQYYKEHRSEAVEKDGVLELPMGKFSLEGRIITFY